jgi:subtilisin family serine protease
MHYISIAHKQLDLLASRIFHGPMLANSVRPLGRMLLVFLLGCGAFCWWRAEATTLTFDIEGVTSFRHNIGQAYGNRVATTPEGAFHYGDEGGFTPHISLTYANSHPEERIDPRFGGDFYADMVGPMFQFGWIDLVLTADEGFVVNLHSFDLGAMVDSFEEDPLIDFIEVRDSSGAVLFQELDSTVSDETARRVVFDPPLISKEMTLSIQTPTLYDMSWSGAIAIDNIVFSEGLDFSAAIEGTVFEDLNRNGLKDDDEPGIQGQQLLLDMEGRELEVVVTDESGSYRLEKLPPRPFRMAYLWDDAGLIYIPTAPGNAAAETRGSLENGETLRFDLGMVSLDSLKGRRPNAPELDITVGAADELSISWSSEPISDALAGDRFPKYRLQVSSDLDTWLPIGETFQAATADELLEVPLIAPGSGRGFYRIALDLSELDLARVNLAGLDLRGVDLSGARLEGADLRGADLRDANLTGVDLTGAFLGEALLDGALLTDAKLAQLSGTPLMTSVAGEATQEVAEAVSFIPYYPSSGDYDFDPDSGAGDSLRILIVVPSLRCTVSEFNAVLVDIDAQVVGSIPGVKDVAPAIVTLRVPTSSPAELSSLAGTLDGVSCIETVVPDAAGWAPALVPDSQGHADWDWNTDSPSGGNWGLEMCQIPQLWNLNAALEKELFNLNRTLIDTGVIDAGFSAAHEDLIFQPYYPAGSVFKDPAGIGHGNHVAGILGAEHGNNKGIEGVNPFSVLMVTAPADGVMSFSWQISEVFRLAQAGAAVINMSLQFRWGELQNPVDPGADPVVQKAQNSHGDLAATLLSSLNAAGFQPIVCYCAGNQADQFSLAFVDIEARWNSPFANAGLRGLVDNVFVIEAVGSKSGSYYSTNGALNLADLWRSPISNVNGHFAAPGEVILSASYPKKYDMKDGTSMASPFFAGVVSYLLMLDPTLTPGELSEIFINTSLDVPDDDDPASQDALLIQAFDAALYIDQIRRTNTVLRMLLDIDDGTPDGNHRMDPGNGNDLLDEFGNAREDEDNDGGIGDGEIDMSDFRRWRDWMLQYRWSNSANFSLDGSTNHPNKDINGDGIVDPVKEYHPRGDFNGDGRLDIGLTPIDGREIPGLGNQTDLSMLKLLFNDPYYEPEHLDALRDSGDIHVDASYMLQNVTGASSVTINIRPNEGGGAGTVDGRVADPVVGEMQIFTVETGQETPIVYVCEVDAIGGGQVLDSDSREFTVRLGGDLYWTPGRETFTVLEESAELIGFGVQYIETILADNAQIQVDDRSDIMFAEDVTGGFGGEIEVEDVRATLAVTVGQGVLSADFDFENVGVLNGNLTESEAAAFSEFDPSVLRKRIVKNASYRVRVERRFQINERATISFAGSVSESVNVRASAVGVAFSPPPPIGSGNSFVVNQGAVIEVSQDMSAFNERSGSSYSGGYTGGSTYSISPFQ